MTIHFKTDNLPLHLRLAVRPVQLVHDHQFVPANETMICFKVKVDDTVKVMKHHLSSCYDFVGKIMSPLAAFPAKIRHCFKLFSNCFKYNNKHILTQVYLWRKVGEQSLSPEFWQLKQKKLENMKFENVIQNKVDETIFFIVRFATVFPFLKNVFTISSFHVYLEPVNASSSFWSLISSGSLESESI